MLRDAGDGDHDDRQIELAFDDDLSF